MNTEPVTRKEKYLAKIRGEDVQIPKEPYTREEKYLNAIATMISDKICTKEEFDKKIAEVESKIGETFTADEKEKLKSLTNPVTVKGTCNSLEELEQKDAKVGDMWFVKGENGEEKSKEYVYTEDKKWDLVGDNSIDLTNYVKDTDFASDSKAGIIKNVGANKSGIDIDEQGNISIAHPDDVSNLEESSQKHTALTLDRVQPVMAYYGLDNRNTLENDFVKQTQIASNAVGASNNVGLVRLKSSELSGVTSTLDNEGSFGLALCSEEQCEKETSDRIALHPNNIPMFMNNYGLESKTFIQDNYVKRITRGPEGNKVVWYKICTMSSGSKVGKDYCNVTFMVTGVENYVYTSPTFICSANSREYAYLTVTCVSNCDHHANTEFGYVENGDSVEIWIGVTSGFSTGINVITLDLHDSDTQPIIFNYDMNVSGIRPENFKKVSIRDSITSDYGITDKKWCHEIKKKVESSRTTNENGICVITNCIVLVAGCSNKEYGVSVTVVPFLNKDDLNNTSLIFKNTKTDEPLKSTEITNLTYYYIEPFDEVTDPQSDEPSISEQPSFYEQDISPNSIEPKPQSTTNVQTKSFSKSETPVTPQSTKTFTTSTT